MDDTVFWKWKDELYRLLVSDGLMNREMFEFDVNNSAIALEYNMNQCIIIHKMNN